MHLYLKKLLQNPYLVMAKLYWAFTKPGITLSFISIVSLTPCKKTSEIGIHILQMGTLRCGADEINYDGCFIVKNYYIICRDVDKPRVCLIKWSQKEKNRYRILMGMYIYGIYKMVLMNLFAGQEQRHRCREQTYRQGEWCRERVRWTERVACCCC